MKACLLISSTHHVVDTDQSVVDTHMYTPSFISHTYHVCFVMVDGVFLHSFYQFSLLKLVDDDQTLVDTHINQ